MIRKFQILILGISVLAFQPSGFAAETDEGEQHAGEQAGEHAEPKREHGAEEEQAGKIHLTPEQAAMLAIQTVKAPSGRADAMVTAPAEIQYVPDHVAEVGPLLQGKLSKLSVDLGNKVEKGQLLATLDSVELARIRSRLMSLQARKEVAQAEYRREKELQGQGISSEEEFLAAKAVYLQTVAEYNSVQAQLDIFGSETSGSDGNLGRYALRSPIDGRVERMDVRLGQTFSPVDTPITVADTSVVWGILQVSEVDIDQVSIGDEVQISTSSESDRFHSGVVSWISSVLDETTRTVPVRVVLETPKRDLRPHTYAKARIMTNSGSSFPLVPDDAVQTIGEDSVVFVPGDEENAYNAVPVTLGQEANDWIEIKSGLRPGTEVVSVGAFDLMSAITASGRSAAQGH